MVQAPTQRAGIIIIYDIQHMYHRTVVPAILTGLVIHEISVLIDVYFLRLEQLGAEHRGQGDSNKSRGTANHRDNPSQLMEHDTRES